MVAAVCNCYSKLCKDGLDIKIFDTSQTAVLIVTSGHCCRPRFTCGVITTLPEHTKGMQVGPQITIQSLHIQQPVWTELDHVLPPIHLRWQRTLNHTLTHTTTSVYQPTFPSYLTVWCQNYFFFNFSTLCI